MKHALTRIAIHATILFCQLTVVGIIILAPVVTWLFFNDFRFWRYLRHFPFLFVAQYYALFIMLKPGGYKFMYSVPLTSPPRHKPDPRIARVTDDWEHGDSCGDCNKCCEKVGCRLLDKKNGLCLSYGSPYWLYFNCGRYPISQEQIDYYDCQKWELVPGHVERKPVRAENPNTSTAPEISF